MKSLKRYIHLYFVFAKNCLAAELEYRMNFVCSIFVELGWVASHLLYLMVIVKTGVVINNLSHEAMYMFAGNYLIITGIFMCFFFTNFQKMTEYIREGNLDLFITKPISLQFITTCRYFNFGYPIADFVVGIILTCIGWHKLNITVNFFTIGSYLLFLILGAICTYAIQFIPALVAFWTVKVDGIFAMFYSMGDLNKIPMGIYGKRIQRIFIYFIPLFPIVNYPTLFLTHKLTTSQIIWGIISPFLLLFITRMIWKVGIKNYTSASS